MPTLEEVHRGFGATFAERWGRQVVADYGRPERAHAAVRNAVGVIELPHGVLTVRGEDRIEYVDNVVTNRVPADDGRACHALILDPGGTVETELLVATATDRVLCLVSGDRAEPLAEEWREKIFIQDVEIETVTGDFVTAMVCGPRATERLASVYVGDVPRERFAFTRGTIAEEGVTVMRLDAPVGEETFAVVCRDEDGGRVFDALVSARGNATPFGLETWNTLTLEAGTPLFDTELEGRIPNAVGLRSALDFEKGCYVGQEVVSRIENRGTPPERLVGVNIDPSSSGVPEPGAALFDGDATVGAVTRAARGPTVDGPIALATVEFDLEPADLSVRVDGGEVPCSVVELPFVEGSERSGRLPRYAG